MSKVSHDSSGNKVVTSNDGSESRTYDSYGKCIDIQHNNTETGESHSHEANHGGLLGAFGAWTGDKKK